LIKYRYFRPCAPRYQLHSQSTSKQIAPETILYPGRTAKKSGERGKEIGFGIVDIETKERCTGSCRFAINFVIFLRIEISYL
jgi:hypothetical protein